MTRIPRPWVWVRIRSTAASISAFSRVNSFASTGNSF